MSLWVVFFLHFPFSTYITDMGTRAQPQYTPPHLDPKSQTHVHKWPWGPSRPESPFSSTPEISRFPTPPPTGLKGASSPAPPPPLLSLPPSREAAPSPRSRESAAAPSPRRPRAAGRPRQAADEHPRGPRAGGGRTDLVQGGESVHIGVIDVGAAVQQLEDLVRVATGASSQEDGAIVELHLGLLALHHGRLEVRLGADPALQLLVPLLLRVRHLHPLSCRRVFLSRGGKGEAEREERGGRGCVTVSMSAGQRRAGNREETLETSSIPQSTGAARPAERTSLPTTEALPPPARPPVTGGQSNVTSRDPGREAPFGQCACALGLRPPQEERSRELRRGRPGHRREVGVVPAARFAGTGTNLGGRRQGRKVVPPG